MEITDEPEVAICEDDKIVDSKQGECSNLAEISLQAIFGWNSGTMMKLSRKNWVCTGANSSR